MNKEILFMDEFKRHTVMQSIKRKDEISKVAERLGNSTKWQ